MSISKIINFIKNDIWRIRLKNLSKTKSFFVKQLRVVLLALRGFDEDKCQLRASALTYYSLLSIVPVVAMAFGIAKGFGFEKMLEKQLLEKVPNQGEVLQQVIGFANTLLENTKGGLIAGIGVAVLFWTVIKVLGNIEKSFNDIWGIKKQRTLGRRFSDYLSIMLICPILFIASSSVTVFVASQITLISQKIALLGSVAPLITFIVKFLPYCVIWILFSFIYIIMPNTKVRFSSALLAGIIAGSIYQLVQFAYINFQIGVAKFNAIYGSFAALPLFLVWLQMSWLIVLFGAEISFARQNVDMYEFEPDCLLASHSFKKLLSLRIANLVIKNFARGDKALSATYISQILEVPSRLARQLLFELTESRVLTEIKPEEHKDAAYQPAQDLEKLTIKYVVDALEGRGTTDIPVNDSEELDAIAKNLDAFENLIEKSPANKLLKEI